MTKLNTILQWILSTINFLITVGIKEHGTDGVWSYTKYANGKYRATTRLTGGDAPITTSGTYHVWRLSTSLPTLKAIKVINKDFQVGSLVTLQANAFISGSLVYVYGIAEDTTSNHLECGIEIIGTWK